MGKTLSYALGFCFAMLGTFLFVGLAKAADVTVGNNTTGCESENNTEVNINNASTIDIQNEAEINNQIKIYANTGDNKANCNNGDGKITTGNINAQIGIKTEVNTVTLGGGKNDGDSGKNITVKNEKTGCESENNANVNIENEREINIENDADIDNDLEFDLNTGNNEAKCNQGDGQINTGDINVATEIRTEANNISIGCCNDGNWNVTVHNERTGCDSENNASVKIENEEEIDIENDADVDNEVEICANTGNNEARCNGEDGSIFTGDINSDIKIVTDVNNVSIDCCENAGGNIHAGNHMTGCDSENNASVNINSEREINIENDLDVENDLNLFLNTGNNKANCNNENGEIYTGNINVIGKIVTEGNNVCLSNCGCPKNDWNIEVSNEITGCDSENCANVCIEDEQEIDIENEADVQTDICIDENTGCNEAKCNNEDGQVNTGCSNIDFQIDTNTNTITDCNEDQGKDDCDVISNGEGCNVSVIKNGAVII